MFTEVLEGGLLVEVTVLLAAALEVLLYVLLILHL
jgi:hypothetical protein